MNAAILFVTSAVMGQTPEIIIPVQHHAPAAAHSSCGPSCGASCCEESCGIGHRLRGRLSGLFHRSNDCCEPCPQPCAQPCPQPRCHSFSLNLGHRRCESSCTTSCTTSCQSSCECRGPGLLDRIRGMFHRDRGCCGDSGCGDTCAPTNGVIINGAPGRIAPSAEPLKEQPKKMPSKNGAKEARIITPPVQAPIAPAIQDAPAINVAPALAPRIIEGDVRNPF